MGVVYYLACRECKEYVDIGKHPTVSEISANPFPPKENVNGHYSDALTIWFLYRHQAHPVDLRSDHDDTWFDDEPYLTEKK